MRTSRGAEALKAEIEKQKDVEAGRGEVVQLELIRSTLDPKGAKYETQATYPLGG